MSSTALFPLVTARPRFARSANVERDAASLVPLDGYVPTTRAIDVVSRITETAENGKGGAWSITGPYGSGKSSLALVLDAVFGPSGTATHDAAHRLLAERAPELVVRLSALPPRGMARGLVTASREPLSHTMFRAVRAALISHFGAVPTTRQFPAVQHLKELLSASSKDRLPDLSPSALVDVVRSLAALTPVLLVLDEFGKNLEASIDGGNDNDPYLLQQVAELGQGPGALPVCLVTLQHLSFADYLGSNDARSREWTKVQGRFDDVAYVDAPSQTRNLISSVFEHGPTLVNRVKTWSRAKAQECAQLGLTELADAQLLAGCYPLHPLAVAVLPELCARYGQNERTLFSFLAGSGELAVPGLLTNLTVAKSGPLPVIALDSVFDYFVGASTAVRGSGTGVGRWVEISTRIRDVQGLNPTELASLKTIAVLNLVSAGGSVRASRLTLEALNVQGLDSLEARGLISWRGFSDEYRIWQGSDFDLSSGLERARRQVAEQPLAELLNASVPLAPMVAARHSTETQTLRVFGRQFVDEASEPVAPPGPFMATDGVVLYNVGLGNFEESLWAYDAHAKPVILATPSEAKTIGVAAVEAAALRVLLQDERVTGDWVANREVAERAAHAEAELAARIDRAFDPKNGCSYRLLNGGGLDLVAPRGSAALSAAADVSFSLTPEVPNEVLNRTELSSQGARARRELLEAMITKGDAEFLGIEGFGPEMAMYLAMLRGSDMHRIDQASGLWRFDVPTSSALREAWLTVMKVLEAGRRKRVNVNDLYGRLLAPPFGMKAGAIPVLLTAVLIATREDVAIYEHGTFKPVLTADLSERLVRNPSHFEVKHFASGTGARRQVIEAVAPRLKVGPVGKRHRVASVLSIVSHLVSRVNALPEYSKKTLELRPETVAVRNALIKAVEPDELLFDAVPAALGLPSVSSSATEYSDSESLAQGLAAALEELEGAYGALLAHIRSVVLAETSLPSRTAVAGLAEAIQSEVLRPEVKALVNAFSALSMADHEWAEYVGTVVGQKPPAAWTTDDRTRFDRELADRCGQFRRVTYLHAEKASRSYLAFDTLRLAVTRPDGTEDTRLVSVDVDSRALVEREAAALLQRLAGELGSVSRARDALLAVLGEQLLPSTPESVIDLRDTVPATTTSKSRRNS